MELLVERFLSNMIDLCLGKIRRLPVAIREQSESWARKLKDAFTKSGLAKTVAGALEDLRPSAEHLYEALEAELKAQVAMQDHALTPEHDQGMISPENSKMQPDSKVVSQEKNRALRASKSLLSSWRTVLDQSLPPWAKGLLKVGEELIEIYGPAR